MLNKTLLAFFTMLSLAPAGLMSAPVHDIVPRPAVMRYTSGYFRYDGDDIPSGPVRRTLTSAPPESYTLDVTADSILITAGDSAGLFYAWQTLLQLAGPDKGRIPCVSISDRPRFAWRGYMQDVSRHFFDLDFLKKQIDAMAALKLNRLHLHLTDAAGWRVEIDRYPLLTSFAAWRDGGLWKDWWFGDRRYLPEGTPGAYGGYYTKEQLRELVEYAAGRYITVVPEIEMPSHSEEVLAAYPELSCTGEPYVHSDFCMGNEETFEFLENILTEIMEIFPSQYIHVGGDEASKKAWKECPLCQARMEALGLAHVDELQSYMIRRIGTFLERHGRTLVGWDEIMQGGADSAAVVMVWRGVDQGVRAAEGGNRTIMSPGAFCYFDTYQDNPATLPPAMGGYTPLSRVYAFEPVPDGLDSAAVSNIIGVQANLWCEYVPTEEHAELMIYPRLFALAEVAWSPADGKDYDDFHRRALRMCERMEAGGYNVFNLAGEYGDRLASRRPVRHKALGCGVVYNAPYYPGYAAGGDTALVDGLHGGWTYSDGRWQGFISRNRLDVVVDLGRVRSISSVEMDFMQVCGPEVFLPAQVIISVSSDGEDFTELWRTSREIMRNDRVTFVTDGWKGRTRARYVRVQARSGQYGGFIFTDEIVVR